LFGNPLVTLASISGAYKEPSFIRLSGADLTSSVRTQWP
jgi:hypothetical protein